ncbi:caspase family protein [Anaerosalibacter sp. Marseille-P3206]|uniref:caspase family protein n=1 Tax=Anaerosalibacter sp. Marseille-P3206 TaxID=1871005 RepID=UPI00135657F4|nr:caspase family protein [Anaerosalibacter sp. Marseille-P3206]
MIKKNTIITILAFVLLLSFVPTVSYGIETPTYRALLIGNSNYQTSENLNGPSNDLIRVENALTFNYFGTNNTPFTSIIKNQNLTKDEIINSIREAFKDAKPRDVSYLYYSGHGAYDISNNTSYLIGVDEYGLSVHELEKELRNIPGTIVVILDSCHSGGFINKSFGTMSENNYTEEDYLKNYNQSILDAFTKIKSRSYLTDSKYKVITAASINQYSYEYNFSDSWGWGGEFTRAFVMGNGYNGNFLADGNYDGNVTLQEIYYYTMNNVRTSNVQTYPIGDNFIIGSTIKKASPENIITWKTSYDIPLNKAWNIKFNMKLNKDALEDNIYILDSNGNKFPTDAKISSDEQNITITPLKNYDYNSQYTIVIEDNIYSQRGHRLKDKVLASFFTVEGIIDYENTCLDFVQNGHFTNHSYPTIREAFDNYFYNPAWEYFYSNEDTHVVEFNGMVKKNGVYGNLIIQFTVDLIEENFNVNYVAFNSEPLTTKEFESLLNAIYDYYINTHK